jgi:DNA-binding NtrC family response regulator
MPAETAQSVQRQLPSADIVFGNTEGMRKIRQEIERASHDDYPVLIEGESGTGKEVIGRFLHAGSKRCGGPFLRLNCVASSPSLLRGEMFGYEEQGAMDVRSRTGNSLGLASGGTFFVDEIGDMDCDLLQTLIAALESGTYRNLNGNEDLKVNSRLVCASSIDLGAGTMNRACGEELKGLLSHHRVHLLPLRERKEDIPQLCEYLLGRFARDFGKPVPPLSSNVLEAFQRWKWPGNIRELENWIARIVIFGTDEAIGLDFRNKLMASGAEPSRRHRAIRMRVERARRLRRNK